ncbi:SDR family NAD(P)-dependent oxidoreductase [Prochlorococcus marinus]|uniref:SDR family NAD(P)-dependent oxidoreductase n=1 Tax=Prochlorococcus marinus TaxID=1219 RepID=UPI0022B37466|nr:SDR family NAD(P)-dependent oxidoreductase [Prochlorococcus marinus]
MTTDVKRRIVITGATSGIGYQAALKMILDQHEIIVPCRDLASRERFINSLKKDNIIFSQIKYRVDLPIADLSDLKSIEEFTDKLIHQNKQIDTLILNAGLQYTGSKEIRRSKQNIELTFAVNHLSHQYITQRLMPLVCKSNYPRIIVTASEVHNPESSGGKIGQPAGLGEMLGIKSSLTFETIDGISTFNADKSYKDSKLCNILFTLELISRLQLNNFPVNVICWAPGLVIPRSKSGFFRYSRKYNEIGQIIFAFFARDVLHITETPEKAGQLLTEIATIFPNKPYQFLYLSNIIKRPGMMLLSKSNVSKEANDTSKAKELWDLTNEILKNFCELNTL